MKKRGRPGVEISLRVKRGFEIDQGGRTFWVPAVLVLPHPLHAYRPPDLKRQKRGIGCRVLVTVSTIAARSVDIDATYLVVGHRQHCSQLLAQGVCRLRGVPAREDSVPELGDGTGRTNRTMRVDRKIIGCAPSIRALGQSCRRVAYIAGDI